MRLDNKDCFIRSPCCRSGQAGVFVAGLAASAFVALGACSGGGFESAGSGGDGGQKRSSSASMAAPPEGFPELTAVPACRAKKGGEGKRGGKGRRDNRQVRRSSSAGPLTFLRVYSKKKIWKDGDAVLVGGVAYIRSKKTGKPWKILSSKGCSDYESVSFGCPGRADSATEARFAPENSRPGDLYWDCTVIACEAASAEGRQKARSSCPLSDVQRHPLRKGQVKIQEQGKGFQVSLEFSSCKMEAEYSCQK